MARRAFDAAKAVLPRVRHESCIPRAGGRTGEWYGVGVSGSFAAALMPLGSGSGGGRARRDPHHPQITRVIVMLDFLMLAYGVGFFIVAILYVIACEKM
jgi:hypothetical protein